jgi:hypothetical protein
MPLTLIVGWYGMNFRDMPELDLEIRLPGGDRAVHSCGHRLHKIFQKEKILLGNFEKTGR